MEVEKREKKKSQGRKKIPIERIARTNKRQVTFSKRRVGIFKKGSELCTLCGVDVVIGIFSPAGKPFTFGHPWPEHVLKRYFNNVNNIDDAVVLSPQEEEQLQQLQQHIEQHQKREELLNQLKMELKMKRFSIQNNGKAPNSSSGGDEKFWWEEPINEELKVEVLEQIKMEMVKVRDEIVRRLHKKRHDKNIIVEGTTSNASAMVSQYKFMQGSASASTGIGAVPPMLPYHCGHYDWVSYTYGF
ncbi:hypothetical protein Sjap_012881 [Stephania japonica]|uniref:MADS-box domain-containing protein n=1 Tax=Stephania japonica TaxID=461633 RepID=A0AAP0NYQ0_9MAGN